MILLSQALGSFIQLLGALAIFAFVLVITYFTTKWIGRIQQTTTFHKNLQTIETIRVANNKYIALIKAGKVYLVVSVGKDDITLLAQLTEEQLSEVPSLEEVKGIIGDPSRTTTENFGDILEKLKTHFPKK